MPTDPHLQGFAAPSARNDSGGRLGEDKPLPYRQNLRLCHNPLPREIIFHGVKVFSYLYLSLPPTCFAFWQTLPCGQSSGGVYPHQATQYPQLQSTIAL
jgi:hypothetical protein